MHKQQCENVILKGMPLTKKKKKPQKYLEINITNQGQDYYSEDCFLMIKDMYDLSKLRDGSEQCIDFKNLVIKKACEKRVGPLRVFGKAKKRTKEGGEGTPVGKYEDPMAHRLSLASPI